MKIYFKWAAMNKGIVECDYGYPSGRKNVGTVERAAGAIYVRIFLGDDAKAITGLKAADVKQQIASHLSNYANEKVTVYSIFDQKRERPIEIRRGDVGGVCDPSTERYHTM